MKLDIILLAYNKEKNIYNIYEKIQEELKNIKHKFIFIDNGSTDKTLNIFREIYDKDKDNIKIISLSKKFEDKDAIISGLKYSKADFTYVYDFKYSTNYIKKSFEFLNKNENCDSVCLCKKFKKPNFLQKFYFTFADKILNINIFNNKTNNRIFRKNMVSAIIENNNIDDLGFNIHYETNKDEENYNFKNKNELKILFLFITLGMLITFIALILFIILLICKKVSLNNTLLIILLLLFGINLIYISLLHSYIYKQNHKSNIKYIIKSKDGFDDEIL